MKTTLENNNRILVVDALRGFALMCIIFLHSVEHFDFLLKPDNQFFFTAETDKMVMDTLMFLFGGKAYSIFALLFGLSFYIQMSRQKQMNIDFRLRFIWRLSLLLLFGFLHSLLYRGDILQVYALLGLVLVLVESFSNRTITILAILLTLQIPLLIQFINACANPDYEYIKTIGVGLGKIAKETYATGSFGDVIRFNLWDGRVTNWAWTYYNGRYMQLLALFFAGMLLGRLHFFENIDKYLLTIKNVLIISLLLTIAFVVTNKSIGDIGLTKAQLKLAQILTKSFADIAQTFLYLSAFVLLYHKGKIQKFSMHLSNVGKMSLTNYLYQAIIGVVVFYGFGFGLYRYLGASWSLMYGVLFFVLQVQLSKWWLLHFHYGPAEWLWRALTFGNFNIKFKK